MIRPNLLDEKGDDPNHEQVDTKVSLSVDANTMYTYNIADCGVSECCYEGPAMMDDCSSCKGCANVSAFDVLCFSSPLSVPETPS